MVRSRPGDRAGIGAGSGAARRPGPPAANRPPPRRDGPAVLMSNVAGCPGRPAAGGRPPVGPPAQGGRARPAPTGKKIAA